MGADWKSKKYGPTSAGDDPRSIDWRVTARRGRVHTKLFREERERPVWLLVDLGASMFFGSKLQLKSTVAVRAAALLAWAAALGGDRVGAVIGNARTERVLPMRSREAGRASDPERLDRASTFRAGRLQPIGSRRRCAHSLRWSIPAVS